MADGRGCGHCHLDAAQAAVAAQAALPEIIASHAAEEIATPPAEEPLGASVANYSI
jgi:hypothetical protein